jgi:hypothetical protein
MRMTLELVDSGKDRCNRMDNASKGPIETQRLSSCHGAGFGY